MLWLSVCLCVCSTWHPDTLPTHSNVKKLGHTCTHGATRTRSVWATATPLLLLQLRCSYICTFWLETTFGISGTVFHWFASYLEVREQSVKVDNILSSPSRLQFEVPQGSVLGPILFTLYSQPLSDLICRHECDYHKYADDTQLSKGAPPDQFQSLLCDIQTCTGSLVGCVVQQQAQTKCRKDRSSSRCIYLPP